MSISQKLLVLGASNYQCAVIQRAKQRGIRVISVDWAAENPGHRLADESHIVSTIGIDDVLRIAKEAKIDGIIAPATDVAVVTQAIVADQLGLFGPPVAAARILTSKVSFFNFLRELGYPVPPFVTLASDSLPEGIVTPDELCVVKPDDSSGGKGAGIVDNAANLVPAVKQALQHSRSGIALVQKYESGFQGTVEGCLLDGEIVFSFITNRHVPPPPAVATLGHTIPSGLSPDEGNRILRDVKNLLTSLEIADTVFDADFVLTREGPKFLELTPRLGGNSLSQLAFYHYGVSMEDMAINLAITGTTPIIRPRRYPGISKVVLLHSNTGGHLEYDDGEVLTARRIAGIRRIVLDKAPGEIVPAFANGRHRFGEVIAQGVTPYDVDTAIRHAREVLKLRIV